MSAIAKPVTILAGLLVAGTATTYTVRSKNSDFSAASLAASDMDAAASAAGVSKPKLYVAPPSAPPSICAAHLP